MDIRYDPGDGFARITLARDWPSAPEQAEVTRALSGLDRAAALLIDLRGVDADTVPEHEELVARVRLALSEIPRRRAYLVHERAQLDIALMIQTLAPHGPAIQVFTDETSAICWLTGRTS